MPSFPRKRESIFALCLDIGPATNTGRDFAGIVSVR